MRDIPEPYIEPPKCKGPVALLAWIISRQWTSVFQGILCDVVWLLGLALTPWAIGRAIDEGLVQKSPSAFMIWLSLVVWLQLQHTLIQGLRDRAGSINYSRAEARLQQLLVRSTSRSTIAVERELRPGAVITMASETWGISFLPISIGSLVSALVAFGVIAYLLINDSILLGILVLVSVPVFSVFSFALVKSMRQRENGMWNARSEMNMVASDTVSGLRIIHGIGGADQFYERFKAASERVRLAGRRVALPLSGADALAILIAGSLVTALTWIGAMSVVNNQLKVGALVAFFGYAGFLVLPVSLLNQAMTAAVAALVSAKQVCRLLELKPVWCENPDSEAHKLVSVSKQGEVILTDETTGLYLRAGELLGVVVTDDTEAKRLVDRLGNLSLDRHDSRGDCRVRLFGHLMTDLPQTFVRKIITVSDPVFFLFSGTMRSMLDPWSVCDDASIMAAMDAVDASDLYKSAARGLDTLVGEGGLEFSGGQRQRLGVARALLANREILVLHEPTSSVDSSTEERIAKGIRAFRAGKATVFITSSPLLLSHADRVCLLAERRVVANGRHEDLLHSDFAYRDAVSRG